MPHFCVTARVETHGYTLVRRDAAKPSAPPHALNGPVFRLAAAV
jgi:hypothetical protein